MIQRPTAGLPYALWRVEAAQGEQAAHFFFPMADVVLLHQVHELKGFGADLPLNALSVVLWPVQLFVRREVCVLRYILAFIGVSGTMKGNFRPVKRNA